MVSDAVFGDPISGASVSCTGRCHVYRYDHERFDGTYILSASPKAITGHGVRDRLQDAKHRGPVGPGGTPTQNLPMVANTASLSVIELRRANSGSAGGTTLTAKHTTQTGSGDLLVLDRQDAKQAFGHSHRNRRQRARNVWKRATGVMNGQADEEIWYVPNAGSVTSVTVTVSGTTSMAMTIADVTGASTTSPLDQVATSSGTSTTPATGPTPDHRPVQRDRHRRHGLEQHRAR